MDSTLAYIDQSSFMGLRALGRAQLAQFLWVYDRPVDMDGLRRFHDNLGRGLLGRRIERSILPFGRHHWVADRGPAGIDVAAVARPRTEVGRWAEEQVRLPIDPETGPPWRLAVQPLTDGGTAVTLIASHTLCDGLGMSLAVADAAAGVTRDLAYPPPRARTRRQALVEDSRQMVHEVPKMARAAAAAIRFLRKPSDPPPATKRRAAPAAGIVDSRPLTVPTVAVFVDESLWDERARALGGTSNALFAAIATRLAQAIGRVDAAGRVTLSIPVSERTEGDTRGNALTGMTVTADPTVVVEDLSVLRADIKKSLAALAETPNAMLAPLPLIPLVPLRVARRLESMVLGADSAPVGCSNLGQLDPAVNRPDGTDAQFMSVRQMEWPITPEVLNRLGGSLFLASGRVNGRVFITVSAWRVDGPNSRDSLTAAVRQALGDFGLSGVFE